MSQTSGGYRVREALTDDYIRLRVVFDEAETFHRKALPHIFRKPTELFPPQTLYAALVEGEDSTVLVAEDEGELIGFATIREETAPADPILIPRRFAMVDMLAVRRDRQRAGIGRALMEAAHAWARKQGLREIELNVWEFNRRAIDFYGALGYTTASRLMTWSL